MQCGNETTRVTHTTLEHLKLQPIPTMTLAHCIACLERGGLMRSAPYTVSLLACVYGADVPTAALQAFGSSRQLTPRPP